MIVAGGAMSRPLSVNHGAPIGGNDTIRIGLVGCGRRGTSAVREALSAPGPTKLVAVADVFANRIQSCLRGLKGTFHDRLDVDPERKFVGFDACERIAEQDLDLVILATPPAFRPQHFETVVAGRKHVYMEVPVAVDASGVRTILRTGQEARRRGLAVAAGLHRRHEPRYVETISRLQDGMIGEPSLMRAYWNGPALKVHTRRKNESEMQYQLRNWCYFTWLSGDIILERHVHNLDVINWMKDDHPVEAQGQGGRISRENHCGDIFDHHMVEFTYRDGSKLLSQCRCIDDCWPNISEHAHGTQGDAKISGAAIHDASGNRLWSYGRGGANGWRNEQFELLSAIRQGETPYEVDFAAMSTMTALLGRMATYSGNVVTWDQVLHSHVGLCPHQLTMDSHPPILPDANGTYPCRIPGATDVI